MRGGTDPPAGKPPAAHPTAGNSPATHPTAGNPPTTYPTAGDPPADDPPTSGWRSVVLAGADLVVPVACGGCHRPGQRWCRACARVLADTPFAVTPRADPGVPVWSVARYRGPCRAAIIALKDHGRRDLAAPLGTALARALVTLARWGELPVGADLLLVPAPTRTLAARRRGGDPVTAVAQAAATRLGPAVSVRPMLVTSPFARDSAGLDARARAANIDGRVHVRARGDGQPGPAAVVLVDDVVTTGATATESVRVLARHGVPVDAVLTLAAA